MMPTGRVKYYNSELEGEVFRGGKSVDERGHQPDTVAVRLG